MGELQTLLFPVFTNYTWYRGWDNLCTAIARTAYAQLK
jgi:hypothetical protein